MYMPALLAWPMTRTVDRRGDLRGDQTVNTYWVDVMEDQVTTRTGTG
jgi:hypothetical protein